MRQLPLQTPPVKKLLKDLQKTNRKITLKIVTNNQSFFTSHLASFLQLDKIKVAIFPPIVNKSLESFLLNNADICFGMGTAALESASLGIPTILADCSDFDFPEDYKYQWLFENKGRGLGRDISISKQVGKKSFQEILQEYEANAKTISEKCHSYVDFYHNINKTALEVKRLALQSTCSPKQLKDPLTLIFFLKRLLRRRLYNQNPLSI